MEHNVKAILNFHLGSLDLSINNSSFWLIIITIVLSLSALAVKNLQLKPGKLQNICEMFYEFIEQQVAVTAGLSKDWMAFLVALFFFILGNNLIGLLPGVHTPTGNITVTASLAVFVFGYVHFKGLREKGLGRYLKGFIPEGVTGPVTILLLPLEIISQLLRPFSLAIRLFANMTAGHLLIIAFLSLALVFNSALVYPLSVTGAVLIFLFEVFVSVIQAYIFTFLSALYIKEAVGESH